jgi:hypothetical protein
MRYGGSLRRLALAAKEGTADEAGRRVAQPVHRVPEIGRAALVGDVAQHGAALAVLDLIEQLAAELEVIALLVDAPASLPANLDAVIDAGGQIASRVSRGF